MSYNYVIIYHGPCDSFHTVEHKPQKLRGLRDKLQKLGYRVDLSPVSIVNYCMLEMCGHEVFRCNVQNLQFNTPSELDPVCKRAVNAVLNATVLMERARNYLYFWSLIEHQMFRRGEYEPKDYWPKEPLNIKPFATCLDCIRCCDILTQKNPE